MERTQQESETELAEVLDRALVEGPQTILRASGVVVVVSAAEYERLIQGPSRLKRLLFDGPHLDDVELVRDRSTARDVDFGRD